MAFQLIVGVSAFVIFPCTIESRRWRSIVEEVYKASSASILICSQLKALAVNMSYLPDFDCMLA